MQNSAFNHELGWHWRPRNPFVRPKGDSRPIHKLPLELLSRIFEFGAAYVPSLKEMSTAHRYEELEEEAGQKRAPRNTRHLPFQVTVSHVCRHWRHVAISTASLWSDIRVCTNTARPPYDLVSVSLERSQRLLIDITVDEYLDAPPLDAKSLYALLIPHINRWRSVELKCAGYQHMHAFLDIVSDPSTPSVPQLQSLRLNPRMGGPVLYIRSLFGDSTSGLRHLTFDTIHVDWNQTWVSTCTSNLTTLELFNHTSLFRPSWAKLATILRGAPRLRKLALNQSGPEQRVLEPPTSSLTIVDLDSVAPIQLLHLTELVLGSQTQEAAMVLLRKLSMPSLKTLILDVIDEDCSDFVTELTGPETTLTPSSTEEPPPSLLTHLERLAILNLSCKDELMATIFEELGNLKALRLSAEGDSDSDPRAQFLLDLLLPNEDDAACLLPQLESLIVYPSMDFLPILREVIKERKNAGKPLKSLYLSLDYPMETLDTLWFLRRLESFGFTEQVDCWNTDLAFEGY